MTKIIMIDDNNAHIEGYSNIVAMEKEYVSVVCKKRILTVYGSNLVIETFSSVELNIRGKIDRLEWSNI